MRVQASDPAYSGYISEQRDDNGRYTVISDKSKAVVTKIKAHNIVPSVRLIFEYLAFHSFLSRTVKATTSLERPLVPSTTMQVTRRSVETPESTYI